MKKIQEFQPMYNNFGNPSQAKELVGLKKNTKFVSVGKKYNMNQQTIR